LEDEPEAEAETVLSIRLIVGSDLDPVWSLFSERAEAAGQSRFLTWSDRARIAPTRVGALADHNLAWRRGSVLNRLSDERPEMVRPSPQRPATRGLPSVIWPTRSWARPYRVVEQTATELGISVGGGLKAMLMCTRFRSAEAPSPFTGPMVCHSER
jgi:hypothetical protein